MARDVANIVAQHANFWQRGPAERPLGATWIGSRFPGELYRAAADFPTGRVRPQDVDVPAFMDDYLRLYEMHDGIEDDAFWVASPFYGIPWVEATLGCPVYYSGESFWVDPIIAHWQSAPTLPAGEGAAWLDKLLEFTSALVTLAEGRYPIATTLMRGPSDMLAAVRGHVEMVYDLYDNPAAVEELVDFVTGHWIDVAHHQLALIPPFAAGYGCHFYRAWAPRQVVCYQEDASASFSPDSFARFLAPADARIGGAFPYSVIHIHSPATWPVSQLLSMPDLSCIEINYDDNGPRLPELLPLLREVQAVKPLIVRGAFTAEEIRSIKSDLSPRGLLLNIVAGSVSEARELMAELRR